VYPPGGSGGQQAAPAAAVNDPRTEQLTVNQIAILKILKGLREKAADWGPEKDSEALEGLRVQITALEASLAGLASREPDPIDFDAVAAEVLRRLPPIYMSEDDRASKSNGVPLGGSLPANRLEVWSGARDKSGDIIWGDLKASEVQPVGGTFHLGSYDTRVK